MAAALPAFESAGRRDALWEHCRNSLGTARLLARERRPEGLVSTACWLAVESACRAVLDQGGLAFDGDVERALVGLQAPDRLLEEVGSTVGLERLAATERAVGWLAGHLRRSAPERAWGF